MKENFNVARKKDIFYVTPTEQEIPEGALPILMWDDFPQSHVVDSESEHGRSALRIQCCECQARDWYYIWSMAGHGKAKCKGCGAAIASRGLYTIPANLYKTAMSIRNKYFKSRKKSQ